MTYEQQRFVIVTASLLKTNFPCYSFFPLLRPVLAYSSKASSLSWLGRYDRYSMRYICSYVLLNLKAERDEFCCSAPFPFYSVQGPTPIKAATLIQGGSCRFCRNTLTITLSSVFSCGSKSSQMGDEDLAS